MLLVKLGPIVDKQPIISFKSIHVMKASALYKNINDGADI